jgi:phage tail sheath gpL-like
MMSYGNYDKLKMLRTELANTAMEWEQKELATVDRTKQDWSGAAVDSVKQVDDITIAAGSAAGDNYNVTINGKTLATAVAHDTNVATTGAALAAAINADAELGALVSASADGAGKVTLTSEVAGNSYTLEVTSNLHSISSANVTQNVTGVDASKAVTKSWQDVYDFWQTRTGNTWSGVRAHVDAVDRQAKDIVNQGSLTDDLATPISRAMSTTTARVSP